MIALSRHARATLLLAILISSASGWSQTNYSVLKVFGACIQDGLAPTVGLIVGSDGALYGTTSLDWDNKYGVVYRHATDGNHTILHRFSGEPGDGRDPRSVLVEGFDGGLYGITTLTFSDNAGNNRGTLFKVNKDGSGYTILHKFGITPGDGYSPSGGLIQGSDGLLYGTTAVGGSNNRGTVFSISLDGISYNIIHHFQGTGNDGRLPGATLLEASDGMLYGTTLSGGTNQYDGTVFRLNKDGSSYQSLFSFKEALGDNPLFGPVCEGPDGALYGSTYSGGSPADAGTVYRLTKDGTDYRILRRFGFSANDPRHPWGLYAASDGFLYGTCAEGGGTNSNGALFKLSRDGFLFSILHSFGSVAGDGRSPSPGLFEAADGALYGTCARSTNSASLGTIFRVNKDGTGYAIVHKFGLVREDGRNPAAELMLSADGFLYGVSSYGGASNKGTIFALRPDGSGYTSIHSFTGGATDGAHPEARLIEATDGMLYGTTLMGGPTGNGTIFQVSKDGSQFSLLHAFHWSEAREPRGCLLEASNGLLYGTATRGPGANDFGAVFSIGQDGSGFTVLRTFTNADGAMPYGGLIEAVNGALYGTTSGGGIGSNGVIFRINKDGSSYSIVHHFAANRLEGAAPQSSLLADSNGVFYGTSSAGGSYDKGTIYRLNQDGSEFRVLHVFGSIPSDGSWPRGELTEGPDNILYGTTQYGGSADNGTIFRIKKDGAEYAIIRHFSPATSPRVSPRGLICNDGALYGATYYGGNLSSGLLFRLVPPQQPAVGPFSATTDVFELRVSGTPSYNHILLRSTNLVDWSTIATNLMPGAGTLTYQDPSPPKARAFYRVSWIP